jgi:hypothetical protein
MMSHCRHVDHVGASFRKQKTARAVALVDQEMDTSSWVAAGSPVALIVLGKTVRISRSQSRIEER